MGIGFGIRPTDATIFSPITGVVESVFPTHHAITLKSEAGIEVLVHIGLETVDLNGEGIRPLVKSGDKVTTETKIAEVDWAAIIQAGKKTDVIIVFTSLDKQLKGKFDLSGTNKEIAVL